MAAPAAAAGPGSSRRTDVYSNMHQNKEDLDRIAEANELYDAVLTGSVDQYQSVNKSIAPEENSVKEEAQLTDGQTQKGGNSEKRLSLYFGNFPWWTSDKDITGLAQNLGVRDIKEIKFAENRINGQSRGYAEVVVTSEESFKILLEKIPQCKLNGDKLDCRFATRQNLNVFEDIANKRMPLRVNSKDSKDDASEKIPSLLSQEPIPPPIPPLFPQHSHPHVFPSLPSPYLAFFPPGQDGHSSKAYSQQKHTPKSTDGDFEELMNRNRAVASSAISKAVSGATAGDLRVAMETLLTAIAIIKQSRVATMATGAAVVLGTKEETANGVVTGTGSETAIEYGTKKIPLAGKLPECLEDTESVPGVERKSRSAPGNGKGKGTEIIETETEIDTADLTCHEAERRQDILFLHQAV
ncbi:unnamed protein product [Pleuronectes platessa]|uniref:RRM domain-containing protein n=1 Tax=Pleuronectes platessa TaxID=8262 RepID=A0A9N7TVG0_PLEPL|nr:unnamed protein product [Pleuronectes platessa]